MLSLPVRIPQAQPLLTSPLPGDPCVKGKRWKVTALPPLYLKAPTWKLAAPAGKDAPTLESGCTAVGEL